MSKSTFKEIEHKVNLALCLVAVIIAIGLAFSNTAIAKSRTDAKSTNHISKLELIALRKVVVGTQHRSKSSANNVNLEIHRNIKPSTTNAMPVIDELNPAFKKSRLI